MSFVEKTTVDILNTSYNEVRIRINYPWNNSFFGRCDNRGAVAVKSWDRYLYYMGWPTQSHWKSGWGNPDYRLVNGSNITLWAGTLPGMMTGTTYKSGCWSYETTVPLTGNRRQNSKTITVGLEYRGTDARFSTPLTTVTLYGTAISYGTITKFTCSADSGDVSSDRYIYLDCEFTNPGNFHYIKVKPQSGNFPDGTIITSQSSTSISYKIPITKDMYQTTKVFIASLYGNDGALVTTSQASTSIEPSGAGLWFTPLGDSFIEISKSAFKNTKNKDIKEVWIKKDGNWHKTKK